MTLKDIKTGRPSKEMVFYRRELETKIESCRSLTEYEKLEKLIKEIDKKLNY